MSSKYLYLTLDIFHFLHAICKEMTEKERAFFIFLFYTGGPEALSHPGVTIWWPIYISRGFSARSLNVK